MNLLDNSLCLAWNYIMQIINDRRLRERIDFSFKKIIENLGASLPNIFSKNKELVGFYRLMHNPRVKSLDWISLVRKKTVESFKKNEIILILSDSSNFKTMKSLLKKIDGKMEKFLGHFCLAISNDKIPSIYGLVGAYFWRGISFTTHPERWLKQAKATNNIAQKVIHVMDREGDKLYLLECFVKEGIRFVIRNKHNRKLYKSDKKLKDIFSSIPFLKTKLKTTVSRRNGSFLSNQKTHPPREARIASLSVQSVMGAEFPSSDKKNPKEIVRLNYVRVIERNPPEGVEPVEWILTTSEDVSTQEGALEVVEIYRKRWIIEEFFKALKKTGCKVEEKRFRTPESWENFITFSSTMATKILTLRTLERKPNSVPLEEILSKNELFVAKRMGREFKMIIRSTKGFLKLIASIGGHKPSNGKVGWQILLRGFLQFQFMAMALGSQIFK